MLPDLLPKPEDRKRAVELVRSIAGRVSEMQPKTIPGAGDPSTGFSAAAAGAARAREGSAQDAHNGGPGRTSSRWRDRRPPGRRGAEVRRRLRGGKA
jgi:hypothetical protein